MGWCMLSLYMSVSGRDYLHTARKTPTLNIMLNSSAINLVNHSLNVFPPTHTHTHTHARTHVRTHTLHLMSSFDILCTHETPMLAWCSPGTLVLSQGYLRRLVTQSLVHLCLETLKDNCHFIQVSTGCMNE